MTVRKPEYSLIDPTRMAVVDYLARVKAVERRKGVEPKNRPYISQIARALGVDPKLVAFHVGTLAHYDLVKTRNELLVDDRPMAVTRVWLPRTIRTAVRTLVEDFPYVFGSGIRMNQIVENYDTYGFRDKQEAIKYINIFVGLKEFGGAKSSEEIIKKYPVEEFRKSRGN